MAIGLGTALAIGAISAAGSAGKAAIQSRAAKKAGQQQAEGAREASRYTQQGLGQLSQLYSPYINSGASAMGTLGRLTTPGAGARYASAGPPNAMPQPPPSNMAVPRMGGGYGGGMAGAGGVRGPYMMAEGGDVMVDRPTMFIAGEAGPERASFQPMPHVPNGGMAPRQGPQQQFANHADYRAAGQAAGNDMSWMDRPGAMSGGTFSDAARAGGASNAIRAKLLEKYGGGGPPGGQPQRAAGPGGPGGPFRGGGVMPMQGAGGWGGQFARMMPPGGPMGAPPPQGGPMGPPMGGGGQRPPMVPQWAPMPPQGWGYY